MASSSAQTQRFRDPRSREFKGEFMSSYGANTLPGLALDYMNAPLGGDAGMKNPQLLQSVFQPGVLEGNVAPTIDYHNGHGTTKNAINSRVFAFAYLALLDLDKRLNQRADALAVSNAAESVEVRALARSAQRIHEEMQGEVMQVESASRRIQELEQVNAQLNDQNEQLSMQVAELKADLTRKNNLLDRFLGQ